MTRHFPIALFGVLLAAVTSPAVVAQSPAYFLQTRPACRVEAVHTFYVTWPKFKAREWVVIVAALPELPSQRQVLTRLNPDGKAGAELSDLKRPIVQAKVAAKGVKQQTHLRYSATFQATLLERKLVPLPRRKQPPKVVPLTAAAKKWYLAATTTFYDYQAKAFRDWLDKHALHIKPRETDVDFARRAFLVICDTCTYEARLDNKRSASAVCTAGKSDCGGLSVLFVATLRANGVPARSLVGHWAQSSKPGEVAGDIPFTMQHTRAEFFASGIGWVPADPSGVIYWHKGNRATMLAQNFGYDAGNFVVNQIDFDLEFDIEGVGKQTVPWTWCTTWSVGEGERTRPTLKDDWKVRPLPLR